MCYLGLHKKKREDSRVLATESLATRGKEDREIQRRKTEKTKEKIKKARTHRDTEKEREKRIYGVLFLCVCVLCVYIEKSDEKNSCERSV